MTSSEPSDSELCSSAVAFGTPTLALRPVSADRPAYGVEHEHARVSSVERALRCFACYGSVYGVLTPSELAPQN